MARKKKTQSEADPKPEVPESETETSEAPSKASAISGAVKGADFDTPDAAMADTSLEPAEDVEADKDDAVEVLEPSKDGEKPDSNAKPDDVSEARDETKTDAPADTDPTDDTGLAGDSDGPGDADTPEDAEIVSDSPDIAAVTVVPTPPPPPPRRSGFGSTFLGGVVAAIIGFGGAIVFEAAEWPIFGGSRGADLEALVTEQSAQLESLSETLASLNAQFEEAQSQDAEALSALEARIDEIPALGGPGVLPEELQATLAAQKAEMEALQDNLNAMAAMAEEQIAAAQVEQENAAAAQARAQARGALNQLRAALNSGGSFAAVLPDIEVATDVPEALSSQAETGVPTASALEAGFADSARAALSASLKATAGDAPTDRLTLFLKDQLGARSLAPREGDDPDAVLSRAEAAVKAGDLDAALTTIDALPDAGQAALEDWAQQARTRKDALAAFESLSDALSGN